MLDFVPDDSISTASSTPVPKEHIALAQQEKKYDFELKPSSSDINEIVSKIHQEFADGLEWKDISTIISQSLSFFNKFIDLTIIEKRQCLVDVLNKVIDKHDIPYLPDSITDPIIKSLIPSFVSLIIPDDIEELTPADIKSHPPSYDIDDYIANICKTFKDGFQITDLTTISKLAMQFVNSYSNINNHEKITMANTIIDFVIDNTNTPLLHDGLTDNIFKELCHSFITQFFDNI
jgi:hypothetical protein